MNRKEGTKHRKRKSNKLKILFWAILFAFVSVLILYLFSLGGENGIAEILNMRDYWLSVGVANGLILIGYLMMYRVDAQNIALNENDLEDTEWLSVKRLKKLKEFQVYDYKAADGKQDGIVIGAEKKGGNVEVITTSQLHALIVGTTGSGKTTGFVDQNIAVLGKSQSKPSIVISDPKKELYEKHAKNLEKQGYKISVLDLREPYSSERWNPMNVLLRRIRLVKDLENNLEQKDGKYYGAGEVFLSYRDARTRMQELKDEIYENAQDLVYTLCPVQNKDQPTWEQGARNLIFGFVLAMCEDCTVPLGLVLGYIVALLANMKVKGSYFFRVLFFLPCMIPSVSSGVLWRDILDPDFGLMTQIFRSLGMNPTFFTSASTAMATLIWTGTWGVGGGMVLWLAAFKNIPSTLYESAQLDGANALQRVFYITIPMSTSMIFYNLVTGVIGSLQVSTTLIMAGSTGGKGPDNSLYFVAVKIYTDAFKRGGLMGYACAFGWVLFAIIGILTFINFKTSKWVQYGEENG